MNADSLRPTSPGGDNYFLEENQFQNYKVLKGLSRKQRKLDGRMAEAEHLDSDALAYSAQAPMSVPNRTVQNTYIGQQPNQFAVHIVNSKGELATLPDYP